MSLACSTALASLALEIDVLDDGLVESDLATLSSNRLFREGEVEQATSSTRLSYPVSLIELRDTDLYGVLLTSRGV